VFNVCHGKDGSRLKARNNIIGGGGGGGKLIVKEKIDTGLYKGHFNKVKTVFLNL